MADMEKVVKGWAMSCINSYLKGDGDTTVVFSADECAQSLGYDNAQSEEAREAIHEALKALISISITYQERDGEDIDYHGSAFATA
jgi:hypothetical protein